MKVLKFLFFLTLLNSSSYAQTLNDAREAYLNEDYKRTERIIRKLVTENPRDLDSRMFGTNYSFWENKTRTGKSLATNGYRLSPKESEYQYFFYDKMTNNRFMIEGSYTDGSIYNRVGLFLEYQYNYDRRNWFFINYTGENRLDPFNEYGDLLGVGFITFLDKNRVLTSSIQTSLRDSFFPNFIIDNELYIYDDRFTYSIDLKLSFYDHTTLITVSPHIRYDWNLLYLGYRPYFVITSRDINVHHRIYAGHILDFRNQIEVGTTFGSTREDGLYERNFYSYDIGYKYKLSHRTNLTFKYINSHGYNNNVENTFLINALWKW